MDPEISAEAALTRLREGNERFVANLRSVDLMPTKERREALLAGQKPFAIILSCADSRAPAEILFDQGLGDLFVIRVAGNIIAPSLVGSVEYAASVLDTHLAVVMGHSSCGAVKATLDHVRSGEAAPSPNIADIVERVRPAVEEVVQGGSERPDDAVMRDAVRANVRHSTKQLREGSPVLEEKIRQGKLMVVGAEYDLASGRVDFFDMPS
jgi:carbonic anhydrase